MTTYLTFVVGIALLIKGADWLIDGASSFAKKMGVSSLIVGLTIVAFGTSTPELVVSLVAVLSNQPTTAFGNVIGSNVANILLVLGAMALIAPIRVQQSTVWKEIPFSLLAALVLLTIANDFIIDAINITSLTRVDGIILLFFFAIFLYYVVELARGHRAKVEDRIEMERRTELAMVGLIVGGIIALYIGGRWTVEGAAAIARAFGISDFLIAATVIAIGTSLPELVTSIKAALKRDLDLSVGNIVGSNIFNIFWILGATALVAPIKIPGAINFDILFLLLITLLLFLFMFVGRRRELERWQGGLFVLLYVTYIALIILRG